MGSPFVSGGRLGTRLSLATTDSLFSASFTCCFAFSDFSDFLLRSRGASASQLTLVLLLLWLLLFTVSRWLLTGTGAGNR